MQHLKLHSNQSISTREVVTRKRIYAQKSRNELLKNVLEQSLCGKNFRKTVIKSDVELLGEGSNRNEKETNTREEWKIGREIKNNPRNLIIKRKKEKLLLY